jgi:predicted dehydrogenase
MAPNVAVVGCGWWGKNLVRNFHQLGALRAVHDASESAAARQVALYNGLTAVPTFGALLADGDIHAIVVATPAERHFEQAMAALLAGKDVFVEKPMALTYAQGAELVRVAEGRRRVLMVGHILEYHPAVQRLNGLIRQGELGNLCYIYSTRVNLGKVRREENILWSFAPHDISVLLRLTGQMPLRVTAVGGTYLQPKIADVTVSTFEFPDNTRAHIFVSWLHPHKEQKLVVVGDRKMAVFDDVVTEGKLKVFDKGIEWVNGEPLPRQTSETTLFFPASEPLFLECEHFLRCVESRQPPLTDGRSGLRVLRVLEASQRSLELDGVPVAVEDAATHD